MYKRKIYDSLLAWKKESAGKTALLIEGARRIGKTTVAKEFGGREFPAYLVIDFAFASESVVRAFDDVSDPARFFEILFLSLRTSPLPRGSLLIFDEVQFCPKARQAIKKLVGDRRYYYLETGSLVSVKENVKDILIPSEEERIPMYPMDYEEFLWACGKEFEAQSIREAFLNRTPFPDRVHRDFIKDFRLYLAIGGMPQAVECYLNTRDYYAVDKTKKEIVALYEEDLRKIDANYHTICHLVWTRMPEMLSHHSTRFRFSSVKQRSDSALLARTLEKLEESKMANVVYRCEEPLAGLPLSKDDSSFKLYFSDVGLFTSIVYPSTKKDSNDLYQKLVLGKMTSNLGMIFENAAAQQIRAMGYVPYYHSWREEENGTWKTYEIDFVISEGGKTIPFEVKSRKVSQTRSLDLMGERYPKAIGQRYVVGVKNMTFGSNLTRIPFYMLFALGQ